MPERQVHGFKYEDYCCENYSVAKNAAHYTHADDAYNLRGVSIQIKYMKKRGEICMGDYFRGKKKKAPFLLHVGRWSKDRYDYAAATIHTIYIEDFEKWNALFDFDYDVEMKTELELIGNKHVDDPIWKKFRIKYGNLFKQKVRFVKLRFKRDHKKQKRIQYAISNRDFRSYFLKEFKLVDIKDINSIMPTHTGLNRITSDKFYTKSSTVKCCMDLWKAEVKVEESDVLIEPSAGDGAFIDPIKKISDNYLFYDLEPNHEEVVQQDFFTLPLSDIQDKYNKVHFIGNPPFGRQSSFAIKFIKKAAEIADTISFILPKSFKKDSMRKHFPRYFWLQKEIDLPTHSFKVNGKDHDVPCVFQIWVKKNKKRKLPKKLKPSKYHFVKKTENPDISFRRVGVNAGAINTSVSACAIQSHYFIKFDDDLESVLVKINQVVFKHDNTSGPKSISKQELIKKYNEIL